MSVQHGIRASQVWPLEGVGGISRRCDDRRKARRRTRSEKCGHHRRHGRGCPSWRTCQGRRRGGARRPVSRKPSASLSIMRANNTHPSSIIPFLFSMSDVFQDVIRPSMILHSGWGQFVMWSRAAGSRTLVRRIAGSTSCRGRPLTLMRPLPALAWATACVHSIVSKRCPVSACRCRGVCSSMRSGGARFRWTGVVGGYGQSRYASCRSTEPSEGQPWL